MAYADVLAWKIRTKARALEYLGGRCRGCGTQDSLDFDHVDPATKVIEISMAIARTWSWARLKEELDKCQLLCRPCHIEKSAANNDGRIVSHGGGRSGKKNCPCGPCKSRKADYMRAYGHPARHALLAQSEERLHGK